MPTTDLIYGTEVEDDSSINVNQIADCGGSKHSQFTGVDANSTGCLMGSGGLLIRVSEICLDDTACRLAVVTHP